MDEKLVAPCGRSTEQLLRNPDIKPTSDVIAKALGEANDAYLKFINELTNHDIQLEWHYYNDGKAWLAKGLYSDMIDTLPNRELICGFLSGKDELINWEPSELFQFYHDTTPLVGTLDELLTKIDNAAVDRAIKIGACNIYHGCVHNMLYEKSDDIVRGLYKSVSFVIQAIVFRDTGKYTMHQKVYLLI